MDIRLDPPKAVLQLGRDGAALAAAARAAGLAATVPTCPGWTVADLLAHTGEVYAHKRAVLAGRLPEPPETWDRLPSGAEPVGWYEEQLAALVAALKATPPDTELWSWFPPEPNAGFWSRRMAQETVIHRADAELAGHDDPHHVDAVVAVDGIDEFLERFLVFDAPGDPALRGKRIAVLTAGATWRITGGDPRLALERDAAPPGDLTVAGTPSHVLYWLWGRLPDDAVDLRGDTGLLGPLRGQLRAAAQ